MGDLDSVSLRGTPVKCSHSRDRKQFFGFDFIFEKQVEICLYNSIFSLQVVQVLGNIGLCVRVCVCVCARVYSIAQSCLILGGPMDCSPPGSSVHAMGFPRQEHWSGLPFPFPGHLPNTGRRILYH